MNLKLNCGEFEKNIYDETDCTTLYMIPELSRPGIQYIFKFDNNYGASVIKRSGSYGYEEDLWEIGFISFDENNDWHLDYDVTGANGKKEFFDDIFRSDVVEGFLSEKDVMNILRRIRDLS